MSPQLLWTIAGLLLTVLTLGSVSISGYQSLDSANVKLIASEVGNVAAASKIWLANNSTDGTFTAVTAANTGTYIPDLAIASTAFTSKVVPAVSYTPTVGSPASKVVITIAGLTLAQGNLLNTALTGKACTVAHVTDAFTATYTCNG
jgi:hypothetical protein